MVRNIKTIVHVGRFLDLLSRELPQLYIWEVSAKFKCSFAINETKFFKALNSILGKVARNAPEEVLFASIRSKCLPILLYGIDACPINELNSKTVVGIYHE